MKKIIFTLIIAVVVTANAFSKGFYVLTYINHTSGDSTSANFNNYPATLNVSAEAGDSLTLYVYLNFSGTLYLQTLGQWFLNGDSIQQSYNVNPINVIAPSSGTFSVLAVNILSMQFTIISTTGIASNQNANVLNVFPTTVTSNITIQLNSLKTNDVEISFFDMNGKELKNDFYKNIIGEFIKSENTEALAKGMYFLRIKSGEDMVEKKFVKM